MNNKHYTICTIAGDDSGPELLSHAVSVIDALPLDITLTPAEMGYTCYRKHGVALPMETIQSVVSCDATLMTAVTTPTNIRTYQSPIVSLRRKLNLFANIRPIVGNRANFTIIRENTEGLYSGIEHATNDRAVTERIITRSASERIARFAFHHARMQNKKTITAIHKATIMKKTDGLFLSCVDNIGKEFPEITVNHMLVDTAAYQIGKKPEQFDVILTTNMFGDILSDLAAIYAGGLGCVASANIGDSNALFEPVHGSVPKHTGNNSVNPLATLRALVLLLEYLEERSVAQLLNTAIKQTIDDNITTQDMGGNSSSSDVVQSIIAHI